MDDDLALWQTVRDALLAIVDAVERLKLKPEYTTKRLIQVGQSVAKKAKQAQNSE